MIDLEQQLRSYGSAADLAVPPLELTDVRRSSPPAAPPVLRTDHGDRPRRWLGLAAAALAVAGLGAIAVISGTGDEAAPPAIDPVPDAPSASETFETPTGVGTITWQRFVGSTTALPARVTGIEGGALVGVDFDPTTRYRSADGGRTWVRTVGDGLRSTIGGIEWIARTDDEELTALWWNDGSGERLLELPEFGVRLPDGLVVDVAPFAMIDDGPPVFDIGDRSFVAIRYSVGPDWDTITGTSEWGRIDVQARNGEPGRGIVRDTDGPAFEYIATEWSDGAELIDGNGDIVLSIEGPIDGLEGAGAGELIAGSAADLRFYEFVDGELVVVDTPWPVGWFVLPTPVDGGVAAYEIGAGIEVAALWHSPDGRQWSAVALPTDTEPDATRFINPGRDGLVLIARGNDGRERFWTSSDGLIFDEVPAGPAVEQRSQGSFGWVTAQSDSRSRLYISPNVTDWEEVDLGDVLDVEGLARDAFIEAIAIDDQIFATLTNRDLRVLLVGTVSAADS